MQTHLNMELNIFHIKYILIIFVTKQEEYKWKHVDIVKDNTLMQLSFNS